MAAHALFQSYTASFIAHYLYTKK